MTWAKQEMDQFIQARLETNSSPLPQEADPRTLVRRYYYDLTGLPPTSGQVEQFEKSVQTYGSDKTVQLLIDQLLESPRYGEHMARMWLDVVRYSDSNGFDWDEFRPQAWRFRDYVVRSFNDDKHYDQFIREQLAGDELFEYPPKSALEQDYLLATGFLRLGPHDNAAALFDEQDRSRAELLADLTETTGAAFLGLTLSCCRCHDHKYDPLSQADHYRIRAFFAAVKFADALPLDLSAQQAEITKHNVHIEEQIKTLKEKLNGLPKTVIAEREELKQQIQSLESSRHSFTHGLLMNDNHENTATMHILFQGNHKSPREEVEAGFLSIFDPQTATFVKSSQPNSTGRRLTLANWIASPRNPLTARVFVNRIWQQLIGSPLVATPNDLGLAGSRPEDSALLDWLASEFIRMDWSVKKLVRLIATSSTYRQATSFTDNHYPYRSPRRLTAEQLRDSLLLVSGLLTSKSAGTPIWPDLPREVLDSNPAFLDDNAEKTKNWYPSSKHEQYCRSLFLVQKRNTRVPMLETFDLPDNSITCARREVSTVAPQAMMLLNSSLAIDVAHALSKRVEQSAGNDADQQVKFAFQIALQRAPSEEEYSTCLLMLKKHSLPEFCRVLLNLNEFVYVD
jgi:hypothetical protein